MANTNLLHYLLPFSVTCPFFSYPKSCPLIRSRPSQLLKSRGQLYLASAPRVRSNPGGRQVKDAKVFRGPKVFNVQLLKRRRRVVLVPLFRQPAQPVRFFIQLAWGVNQPQRSAVGTRQLQRYLCSNEVEC